MIEWLNDLVPWGVQGILWVQGFRTPWLDLFFGAVTQLGNEYFYIAFMGGLYWAVRRAVGLRVGYAMAVAFLYPNALLKEWVGIPRPSPAQVAVLAHETSPAFPSGHAQSATVIWGYLAAWLRRGWAWAAAGVLVFLVALSRVYLGVHYPQDVVGGMGIGLVCLGLFLLAERWLSRRQEPLPPWAYWGLTVGVPVLLFVLRPALETARALGLVVGFGVGQWMEGRYVCFADANAWGRRALRLALGLVVTLAVYLVLAMLLPATPLLRAMRYAAVGWVAIFGVPWLLVRLGLAGQREAGAEG